MGVDKVNNGCYDVKSKYAGFAREHTFFTKYKDIHVPNVCEDQAIAVLRVCLFYD